MEENKIAPKEEVKDESIPKTVVSKHPTSLNEAEISLKPTPDIKVNPWVEVMEEVPEASKNLEVSENLVKPTKQPVHNVEVGEKETKNAKSECELDIVNGGHQREENVFSAKKANVKDNNRSKSVDAIELVEETPSKPKTNFAKIDTKIIMEKKISNDVKEEPNNSIKSMNFPSKAFKKTTKEGESKGKDAPKGKSKCRKVLDVIDKVGKNVGVQL